MAIEFVAVKDGQEIFGTFWAEDDFERLERLDELKAQGYRIEYHE